MRHYFYPVIAATLIAPVSVASEPSIITTDVETGIILSSNNIDVKQDPYLVGKLAMLFLGLNDVMTGDIDPDHAIAYPEGHTQPFAFVLKDAASSNLSSSISMTLLASQIAQSPAILNERLTALFRKIGMRATRVETVRTSQGEPNWSGYTTNRDIARITTALLLTHGDYARKLLPQLQLEFQGRKGSWIYRDGMCLTVISAPSTGRELVSVIQGASSEENCAGATDVAIRHNDGRIEEVAKSARPK